MTRSPAVRPLHGSVLDGLGMAIAAGRITPGTVLTLDGLCQEYAVSRSVAREAVRVLESMGLIASRRRVGLTVRSQRHWSVFDPQLIRWRLAGDERVAQLLSLSELRLGVEPVAARLAATRATPEQSRQLADAVRDMEIHGADGALEEFLHSDQLFHRTLLEASGNEMLASLGEMVAGVLEGRTHHDLMPSRPNPAAIALHDAVARAVRTRDPDGAERAMRAIIDESAQAMADEQG